MKKIALFLAFILLFGFSGCRSESTKSKPSSGNVFTYTTVIDIFSFESKGEIDFFGYSDGKFIVEYGGDKRFTGSYDIETGEFTDITGNAVFYAIDRNTFPINGYETFVEEENGKFLLYTFEPENPGENIKGPVSESEIVFSAYDGENFIWSSAEGLFIEKNGKSKLIDNYCGKFAVLAENFVIWPDADEEKIGLYRMDMDYLGGYGGFSDLKTVYADEDIIIFENDDPALGEKYLSYSVKRGEETDRGGLEAEPSVAPYTIAVDGYLYYCYYENSGIVPEENQIIGKITSVYDDITTCPRRNNQANIMDFLGMRYALVDGEILLEDILGTEEKPITVWYKCKKSWALNEMNLPD